MSVYSFESGNDDRENDKAHEFDELVAEYEENTPLPNTSADNGYRHINFILDHSAFVRGIGNIKRWFNKEYARATYNQKPGEKIKLNIHIPSYTLHEFDFVKKGNTMIATNAREAIKFIDKLVNEEEDSHPDGPEDPNSNELRCSVNIEVPNDHQPSWNECLKYKIYSPLIKEFPNYRTKFDSNLLGQNATQFNKNSFKKANERTYPSRNDYNEEGSFTYSNKLNDIQYENSESYENALAHGDSPAEMPERLKYLIKSCIHKKKHQQIPDGEFAWRLVTEDPITKIWAISFGIECMNINEAELLIFQGYDINAQKKAFDPHFQYTNEDKPLDGPSSILQNTIDTTVYRYSSIKETSESTPGRNKNKKKGNAEPQKKNNNGKKSANKKGNKSKPLEGVVNEGTGIHGGAVKKERFDAINYAPRGTGELWRP